MADPKERLERLRRAGRLKRRKRPRADVSSQAPSASLPSEPLRPSAVGDLLALPGMQEAENERGRYLERTLRFELTHRQGKA
ncbi:MAG: hypothetical protein D6775_09160, partial [Caldilineae bacterium]